MWSLQSMMVLFFKILFLHVSDVLWLFMAVDWLFSYLKIERFYKSVKIDGEGGKNRDL